MDFLVRFPPRLVQHLNDFTIKGGNKEVLNLIYQDLTSVIEFEDKPLPLPITPTTTLRILTKLIKNISQSHDCKCLTQSYYVLGVLIDEDYNNETSTSEALEWLEKPHANTFWSHLKENMLHFVENPDEYWLSEYCLRFLSVFMGISSSRQLLVGAIPGVTQALLTVLSDPQTVLLSNVLESALSCVSSLLGRNMLFSTRNGSLFIDLQGFRVLNIAVTDVIDQGVASCAAHTRVSTSEMDVLIAALDAWRSYFAWITQHYDHCAQSFQRDMYCYSDNDLLEVASRLLSLFHLQHQHHALYAYIAEALLTTSVCFGDMIRNNFEPEGAMMELGLLYAPPPAAAAPADDVSDRSGGGNDAIVTCIVCSDSGESNSNKVDTNAGVLSSTTSSSDNTSSSNNNTPPHQQQHQQPMTLLDYILAAACGSTSRGGGRGRGHTTSSSTIATSMPTSTTPTLTSTSTASSTSIDTSSDPSTDTDIDADTCICIVPPAPDPAATATVVGAATASFLLESVLEWGEESALIASAIAAAYFDAPHRLHSHEDIPASYHR
jgi:hypothetical protein